MIFHVARPLKRVGAVLRLAAWRRAVSVGGGEGVTSPRATCGIGILVNP